MLLQRIADSPGVRQLAISLAVIALVLSVAGFVRRGADAWQLSRVPPGVATTSGFEEESHFALWRAVRGLPVYADETRLPFASAYFNWLFYASYGAVLTPVVRSEGNLAIVWLGRLVTAAGAVVGALVFLVLLRPDVPHATPFTAAIASMVFFGPLVGWWAHTARPDVWALACEAAALAVFIRWHRAWPWRTAAAVLLLCYAAWAFKQSYVGALASVVLYLIVQRDWSRATMLILGTGTLWAATLLLLGDGYRVAQQHVLGANDFDLAVGIQNLLDAAKKTAPLVLLATAALWLRASGRANASGTTFAFDAGRLGVVGLAVSLPLCFAMSCKLGAASNYFFTPALMLGLIATGGLGRPPFPAVALPGLATAVLVAGAFLSGLVGQTTLSDDARVLAARWAAFRTLPEPRYSADRRLQLPWLNPNSPPLVVAFNYDFHQRAGTPLERGGIGGMIEAAQFASLLLPEQNAGTARGGTLRRYVRGKTVAGMAVYRRASDIASP